MATEEKIIMQQPGQPATVSAAADATGGIMAGHFIDTDVDKELFQFKSDDTPLMQLMLMAKKVKVDSPVVDHYMVDEPICEFSTSEQLNGGSRSHAPLPLLAKDQNVPRPNTTLLVPEVWGYDTDGKNETEGKPLMLFVTGQDPTTNNPVVRAVNGRKSNPTDEECLIPTIPAGTKVVVLSNALYETQKEVDPDLAVPQKQTIYLQKRGMNTIVSDYFESQKKRIPFSKALIAEQAITNFKVRGNRTLWAGRPGKFRVSVPKMGMQMIYMTEGVRWQIKRELEHTGKWTIEEVIALAKMYFTGEDVPKTGICLAGKGFLESIQCIDYSKHPEVQITTKVNPVGWKVTNFHTVFGDIEFRHDSTLDRLGWANSAALLAPDRLVHYVYSAEHKTKDRVEGEEATREGILVWDALALKGTCHIWINGEQTNEGSDFRILFWDSKEEPPYEDNISGTYYYLLQDCPAIKEEAHAGQVWKRVGSSSSYKWEQYTGPLSAMN